MCSTSATRFQQASSTIWLLQWEISWGRPPAGLSAGVDQSAPAGRRQTRQTVARINIPSAAAKTWIGSPAGQPGRCEPRWTWNQARRSVVRDGFAGMEDLRSVIVTGRGLRPRSATPQSRVRGPALVPRPRKTISCACNQLDQGQMYKTASHEFWRSSSGAEGTEDRGY